jgi:hypothetical protein
MEPPPSVEVTAKEKTALGGNQEAALYKASFAARAPGVPEAIEIMS